MDRYQRQIQLTEVGSKGQLKLKKASVLVVGAGGLGCPILMYLAAAGVGRLGIVDHDIVALSNLHRQVLYTESDIGNSKCEVAKIRLAQMNSEISIETYPVQLTHKNVEEIFASYSIIVDGTDSFQCRYLINDACVLFKKPIVSGAVQSFEGQVSIFNSQGSGCYRCLFPSPPPPELSPNCSEAGILGVLPGWVGMTQANEVLKLILNIGELLTNKLLMMDALDNKIRILPFTKNSHCECCGSSPKILTLADSKIIMENQMNCSTIPTITLDKLKEKLKTPDQLLLVDVRTEPEAAEGMIPHAKNIPLDTLENSTVISQLKAAASGKELILYCRSGSRSLRACEILKIKNVIAINYSGSYLEWSSVN
jgi:sulfur-carrier protein adenylyltransferase/sulfurtransferase